MPTLERVEAQLRRLTNRKQEVLLDWLSNMLEEGLQLTNEFKADRV